MPPWRTHGKHHCHEEGERAPLNIALRLTVVVVMGASALEARKPLEKWVLHLNGKGEEEKGFADGDGI